MEAAESSAAKNRKKNRRGGGGGGGGIIPPPGGVSVIPVYGGMGLEKETSVRLSRSTANGGNSSGSSIGAGGTSTNTALTPAWDMGEEDDEIVGAATAVGSGGWRKNVPTAEIHEGKVSFLSNRLPPHP